MSRDRRGIDKKAWARVRLVVFRRDGYRCVECGGAGRLECDHVLPIWKYPNQDYYALDGLQTLCKPHHLAKSIAERGPAPTAERKEWQAEVARMVAEMEHRPGGNRIAVCNTESADNTISSSDSGR